MLGVALAAPTPEKAGSAQEPQRAIWAVTLSIVGLSAAPARPARPAWGLGWQRCAKPPSSRSLGAPPAAPCDAQPHAWSAGWRLSCAHMGSCAWVGSAAVCVMGSAAVCVMRALQCSTGQRSAAHTAQSCVPPLQAVRYLGVAEPADLAAGTDAQVLRLRVSSPGRSAHRGSSSSSRASRSSNEPFWARRRSGTLPLPLEWHASAASGLAAFSCLGRHWFSARLSAAPQEDSDGPCSNPALPLPLPLRGLQWVEDFDTAVYDALAFPDGHGGYVLLYDRLEGEAPALPYMQCVLLVWVHAMCTSLFPECKRLRIASNT